MVRPETEPTGRTKLAEDKPKLIGNLALERFRGRLLSLIKGRKDEAELAEFTLAASMTTNEGKINQQLAELMNTNEEDVVNRRNRLLRAAGVKELREGI